VSDATPTFITYVATMGAHLTVERSKVKLPRWSLSAMREGIDYIEGQHEERSAEAQALLAAYRLVESAA